jgi:hypothetical protein
MSTMSSRVNRLTLWSLLLAAGLAGAAHAQTPIVEYRFNETGMDAVDSGTALVNLPMHQWDGTTWNPADNHSAASTGVSGAATDRAYHDPSIMLDPGQTAGSANSHYFGGYAGNLMVEQVQGLAAITVQGWFKPPAGKKLGEVDGSYGALVGGLGNSTNDSGWVIRTLTTAEAGTLEFRYGEEAFSLDHRSVLSTAGIYSEIDQWVFFAATLDAVTGNVQFFKGTTTAAVTAAGTGNQGSLDMNIIKVSNRPFFIGNQQSEGLQWARGRAFNGDLDNIRVFGSVLTEAQLEAIRANDLLPPVVVLQGDYNNDAKVDAADYVLWRKDPASFGNDPGGYNTWRANFGSPPGSGTGLTDGAVPEPSVTAVTGLLLGVLSITRRRVAVRRRMIQP